MRTRSRSGESITRSTQISDGTSSYEQKSRYTEVIRDSRKGPGDCSHIKLLRPVNGPLYASPSEVIDGINFITPIYDSYYLPNVNKVVRDLVDSDLKGSQFEILTFAAELDETIAMFSKKFLMDRITKRNKGAYGEYTWGIQPFISDTKKLLKTVQNQMEKLPPRATNSVKRMRRYSFLLPFKGNGIPINCVGTVRVRGERKFLFPEHSGRIQKALWYLDQIGFHPDLKTPWDLLPFSFAVDYLIPVGDIIESLHPRGWLRSASDFSGDASFKGQVAVGHHVGAYGNSVYNIENWCYYSVYHRFQVPKFDAPQLPEWKAPSLKEIFNIAYLTTTLKQIL